MQRKGIEVTGLPKPEATRNQSWISAERLAEQGYLQDREKFERLLGRFSVVVVVDTPSPVGFGVVASRGWAMGLRCFSGLSVSN